MKASRLAAAIAVAVALTGCGSDDTRTDRVEVEGQPCIVVRDGARRIIAIDCDWSSR